MRNIAAFFLLFFTLLLSQNVNSFNLLKTRSMRLSRSIPTDSNSLLLHQKRSVQTELYEKTKTMFDEKVDTNRSEGDDENDDEDEALIERVMAEVLLETGVELDQLINPSKVINLERDLIKLNKSLESEKDTEEKSKILEIINKKKNILVTEKRLVMRGWLKNLFVGQSILVGILSLGLVYNSIPGFDVPLPVQVLGFWTWWLFIVPSLRARKPAKEEKDALNIAFLATPVVSLIMPTFTKDVAIIWWGNAIAVLLSYLYAYLKPKSEILTENVDGINVRDDDANSSLPPLLVKAFKALDYGSGQERGARK